MLSPDGPPRGPGPGAAVPGRPCGGRAAAAGTGRISLASGRSAPGRDDRPGRTGRGVSDAAKGTAHGAASGTAHGRGGRRALLTAGAALLLAACGFRPALGPGGLYGQIRADDPTDRYGFDFVDRFEQTLGAPEAARYGLAYRITIEESGVAGASASSTTRFQLPGRIDYVVIDLATGQVRHRDTASALTAYSAVATTVAEQAARADALRRLIVHQGGQVATGLLASAVYWADPGPAGTGGPAP